MFISERQFCFFLPEVEEVVEYFLRESGLRDRLQRRLDRLLLLLFLLLGRLFDLEVTRRLFLLEKHLVGLGSFDFCDFSLDGQHDRASGHQLRRAELGEDLR